MVRWSSGFAGGTLFATAALLGVCTLTEPAMAEPPTSDAPSPATTATQSRRLDAREERGLAVIGGMAGPAFAAGLRDAAEGAGFGSAMTRLSLGYAFADVWGRSGLEQKQRSLVVLGVLIALRQTQELKAHIRIGIGNGLTVGEIEEAILQAAPYAGFPAASSANGAAIEVLRDLGLAPVGTKTMEERGVLKK